CLAQLPGASPRSPISVQIQTSSDAYSLSLHDALPICASTGPCTSTSRRTAGSSPETAVARAAWPLPATASGSTSSLRPPPAWRRSEEHTSELQSRGHLVCRLLLDKKNDNRQHHSQHTR